MRGLAGASGALFLLATCSPSSAAQNPSPVAAPTQEVAPRPADPASLATFYGSYRADDGRVFVIARLGWFFDMADGTDRTIYVGSAPNRFSIGPGFAVPRPKFADLSFNGTTLSVGTATATILAQRVAYPQSDVTIPVDGAQLAGSIAEPLAPGSHPGIVIVHGSERGERYFYDIWVGIYTALGLTVLTYDKRGVGSSTGHYPGELASEASLQIYADDAAAALAFLSSWRGVNPNRVALHGGSQGGWTVPLAIQRHGLASFAILVSAPATTVGQTTLWKDFTGGGAAAPTESEAAMNQQVRADHSGYDPGPALNALRVPALWLLGSNDRNVPTLVCAEILAGMGRSNFSVRMLPTGHGLLVNPTGLAEDDKRSPGLAPDLVPTIRDWLQART